MLQPCIPFDEIAAGKSARLAVIEDMQYLSVRDLFMHIGGYSSNTANKAWERFSPDAKNELKTFCRQWKFPGPGNPTPTTVINFPGALKLTMMIGGENAKKYRSAMVSILQRYYAGDGSLLEEVEANAQSAGPVQQMARASLAAEVAQDEDALCLPFKKRRLELEMEKMEADVEAQQIANRAAELENEAKRVANRTAEHDSEARRLSNVETEREHLTKVTESYKGLCVDTVMDERARLILKDNFLNMAMLNGPAASGGQGLLTNGKPTSLSLVADKLKLSLSTGELISLGQELKKRYVEKHGRPPPKHSQLCGGRATLVNTYMEADTPLIEEVLRAHAAGRA